MEYKRDEELEEGHCKACNSETMKRVLSVNLLECRAYVHIREAASEFSAKLKTITISCSMQDTIVSSKQKGQKTKHRGTTTITEVRVTTGRGASCGEIF